MHVPDLNNPIWKKILLGEKAVDFSFLGLKIFIGKAQVILASDKNAIDSLASEMHQIICTNLSHPKVVSDLEKILH